MPKPEPVRFPLDDLLEALVSHRFYLGVDTHLRLQQYLDWFMQKTDQKLDTLKYQLAALLCNNDADQQQFYTLFDQHIAPYFSEVVAEKGTKPEPGLAGKKAEEMKKRESQTSKSSPATTWSQAAQPALTEGKSGPVRVELKFPSNDLRIWNLAEIEQAVRPLREKEWATVLEWDIPATIRSTIRAGGMPTFELRRRKRAPQYLLLIDQRGPRDHLAGLYAELAAELNRRDVDAEHFFYDRIPSRCWKDRRDYGSYTNIESLQSQFAGSRLLVIGEPEGLLDLPQLRPSNLAADLRDTWPQMALLCTRPTAEWGNAELALCQLFPVAPANAAGLTSLTGQWAATEVYAPQYWKIKCPEATVPPVRVARPQEAEPVLENLRYYLGRDGFLWLCAAALYPELYYELTALLHDESIPPPTGRQAGDWDTNRVWWNALLRLSRLDWFRRGSIPLPAREQLRQYFEQQVSPEQRGKVWDQLVKLLEITSPPPGSFAADSLQVTLDWYKTEHQMADPLLTEVARQQLGAAFWSTAPAAVVSDPLARRIAQQPIGGQKPAATVLFKGKTTAGALNVRSGPSNAHPIVDKLGGSSPVSIFETSSDGNWYRIGENRWVSAKFVEIEQAPPSAFRILWVDDTPENNSKERALLEERFGASFTISTSTDDALRQLAAQHFDLVISDAVRGDDHEAGMKLLQGMQERRYVMPFVVYTSATNFDYYKQEFTKAGATAVARGPRELLDFVSAQMKEKQPKQEPSPLKKTAVKPEKRQGTKPTKIFIAYAHEDAVLKDELVSWLKTLEQAYQYKIWDDSQILPGDRWEDTIKENLETAEVALCMLSADFLVSDYLAKALNPVIERATRGAALLIPVILRACLWQETPLSRFQAANSEPVAEATDQIEALYDVSWQIIRAIGRFRNEIPDSGAITSTQKTPPESRFETKLRERLEKIKWEKQPATEEPAMAEAEPAAGAEPPVSEAAETVDQEQSAAKPEPKQEKAPEPPVSKEQIQQLIAAGRTEEALALLAPHSGDALLLQARYNNGKKQYDMGLIEFSAWQRVQAQVNFAALELSQSFPDKTRGADKTQKESQITDSPVVYISYHHTDSDTAKKMAEYLKKNRINIIVDWESMQPGESISDFIEKSIKKSEFVLSLVSRNSLQSPWISFEFDRIFSSERSKWIPCRIDNSFYDPDFAVTALKEADLKIKDLNNRVKEINKLKADSRTFTDELERTKNYRNRLSEVIWRLKNVLVLDISGKNFNSGMAKVLEQIRRGNTSKS